MSLSYIKRAEQGNHSALSFVGSIILCFGALLLGSLPLMMAIIFKKVLTKSDEPIGTNLDQLMGHFPYPVSYALLMSGFVILLGAVWFSIRFIHKRKFGTLWSDRDKFRIKDFLKGLISSILIFAISDLLMHQFDPGYHTWAFNANQFWTFLPFAIIFVPLQTLAEEALFRGHLYQAVGLATKNKWTALVICSVIFGVFHFGNSEMGINFWKMGLIYIGTGFMIGLTVVFSKGIEFGWAFHLVNNMYLTIIVTFPTSSLNGPTLYTIPQPSADRILLEFFIQFAIFVLALAVLYRKNLKTLLIEPA
jgi:membrane protease YdiL (CAAX protease family)